jgi:hypothetical protein
MKIYINDIIEIHKKAFMLDDVEEHIFEEILLSTVEEELDYDDNSIFITEETLMKYYSYIIFSYIETQLFIKCS